MTQIKKGNAASGRVSTGITLLALGLVAVGFLLAVGSWALAGTMAADPASTPTLSEAYGEQFLLTNSQVANQPAAVQETSSAASSDSIVSPLTNWMYTARARRHVSPAN